MTDTIPTLRLYSKELMRPSKPGKVLLYDDYERVFRINVMIETPDGGVKLVYDQFYTHWCTMPKLNLIDEGELGRLIHD